MHSMLKCDRYELHRCFKYLLAETKHQFGAYYKEYQAFIFNYAWKLKYLILYFSVCYCVLMLLSWYPLHCFPLFHLYFLDHFRLFFLPLLHSHPPFCFKNTASSSKRDWNFKSRQTILLGLKMTTARCLLQQAIHAKLQISPATETDEAQYVEVFKSFKHELYFSSCAEIQ